LQGGRRGGRKVYIWAKHREKKRKGVSTRGLPAPPENEPARLLEKKRKAKKKTPDSASTRGGRALKELPRHKSREGEKDASSLWAKTEWVWSEGRGGRTPPSRRRKKNPRKKTLTKIIFLGGKPALSYRKGEARKIRLPSEKRKDF